MSPMTSCRRCRRPSLNLDLIGIMNPSELQQAGSGPEVPSCILLHEPRRVEASDHGYCPPRPVYRHHDDGKRRDHEH
ncbi:hypothetical protein MTO96_045261 [Rhipicephalus appendiculatus]